MKQITIFLFAAVLVASCNNSSGGWSKQDEGKWLNACMNQLQGNPQAKEICSCVLQKAEKAFPTYTEEEAKGTAEQGTQWTQECLNGANRGGGGVLNNNNNNNNNIGGNNNNGGGWSNADKQKFMNTCVQNATNAGGDQQTARTHCECTLGKIEKKFNSFNEANRTMTSDEVTAIEQECNQEQYGNGNQ